MKYELILWLYAFIKVIPGRIGCKLRAYLLPSTIGKETLIWDNVHIDNAKRLKVGSNSSINRGCILNCGVGLTIGNDVLIGPNVIIYTRNHEFENTSELIRTQGYAFAPVVIEDNVWVASGCIILPGVRIGRGAVVAAGAVVTKDVPQNAVVAGVPAQIKRLRGDLSLKKCYVNK